ncbi:MAG: flagellar M-ring protein FliF [Deltaproteobacteria bacterium RBG_13_43_22]|nr:MAG: flagellar M-ring protein FliF [Deltaproteobacteria bacterium RBG_13_43_22]
MADLIENIKNWPIKKKISLLALIGVVVASMILIITWSQKSNYQILYANVNGEDSGLMIQKLKELKVPYKVNGGGILVPSEKVYELRLQLAAQGLPQGGGVGFEIFDKTNFGTSDFVQKLNYRRALQGELSRTIQSLSEIESCRVHLAVPEKNLFAEKESKPSASIMVKLKAGRALTQNQVQGIVHLVSSSVEGLSLQDVTIIDNQGGMLTRPVQNGTALLSNNQLELQRNYEKEIEARVVNILEPVVGKEKVKAKVFAELDFTQTEKTEEKYDPNGQVVRSEQKNQEKSVAGGTGGIPGTTSNLPNKKAPPVHSSGGVTQKLNETVNYEISKVVSRVISPSQELKRISVAVVVDGTYAVQQGSKAKKYTARPEEEIKRYEDLVKKAIGFSVDRGDQVRVVNMPFEVVSHEDLPESGKDYWTLFLSAARYAAPLVAFILILLFILKPLTREFLSIPISGSKNPALTLPQTVSEIERRIESPQRKALTMEDDVRVWAKKNPDQAAHLIKGWTEE